MKQNHAALLSLGSEPKIQSRNKTFGRDEFRKPMSNCVNLNCCIEFKLWKLKEWVSPLKDYSMQKWILNVSVSVWGTCKHFTYWINQLERSVLRVSMVFWVYTLFSSWEYHDNNKKLILLNDPTNFTTV